MAIEKKGERTILTGRDYRDFRGKLHHDQRGRCIECGGMTVLNYDIDSDYSFHVSHRGSRGMGAGFRDDVVGPKKGQVEGGKCGRCHRKEHNQQWAS